MSRIYGILIVLALVAGLWFFNRSEITLTTQDNFELLPIGTNGWELKSVLHINNPNMLSVTVNTIREQFYINGTPVGQLDMGVNRGIPGHKETELPVSIRFTVEALAALIADTMVGPTPIKVTGTISYNKLVGEGQLEVSQSGKLNKKGQ